MKVILLSLCCVLCRMLGLGWQQFEVLKPVVGRVSVDVVNHLSWEEKASNVLLHHQPVFENEALAGFCYITRMGMTIGGNDDDIPIRPNLSSAAPAVAQCPPFPIHRIVLPAHTPPEHRVPLASNISGVTGICVGAIQRSPGARLGAVDGAGSAIWDAELRHADRADLGDLVGFMCICAPTGAEPQSDGWWCFVCDAAVFADPVHILSSSVAA